MKNIYRPTITVYDKINKHTAVENEDCYLYGCEIHKDGAYMILKNSQENRLEIPFVIFEKLFIHYEK